MIKRLYINNFKCLENFELPISNQPSSLLIGPNGVGKSSVGEVLSILQKIARGCNRVGQFATPKDFAHNRSNLPMRFEIEVDILGESYKYNLALELPEGFKEMRVTEEMLSYQGVEVYARNAAQVTMTRTKRPDIQSKRPDARFLVDWHLVALPIIQHDSEADPVYIFRNWLTRMLILAPLPTYISGDSESDTLSPRKDCSDFGAWFSGLLAHSPSAYTDIDSFVRRVMPDFEDIKNPHTGKESRSLYVQFRQGQASLSLEFKNLSDGEKCFFICATVLASNKAYGPVFCFWDEPGTYLSLSEVDQFIMELRRSFHSRGQLVITSHHPEAIRRFSAENTLFLHRQSRLEPTVVRPLDTLEIDDDLIESLILGDVVP
ncbi:MAG: AAA family ATPase [Gammaproteobacteria bacterium]|nr:AAA family ATPase [Gammaproteobacteria bacterium]